MARKRKAGDGTVRQRKDGRWEGRVVIGYDDNGYPKTKNVLAKTKKECVEKLQKLKEECGGLKPEKVRPEMPFGDWLTYWYENHSKPKIRPTTQETYESRIRLHIIPEIGSIPLNKLTQNDLQQFYGRIKNSGRKRFTDRYGEGLSDRMVRMCHATCRSALEKAVQDGLIRVNPAIGCKLPPKKAREMQVLTREELQRFLIQAKFEGYYEVFLLDLATGLRRGELMALQWDDLNFKTGVLNVNKQVYDVRGQLQISTPKTKSSIRKIVLPPAVVAVLREYKKTVDSRWMFPSPVKEDCPITPGVVRRRLQLILEHAGCKHVRFHDLRHTFATLALENGMDVKTLSTMLGHVSAATTLDIYGYFDDYTLLTDEQKRQVEFVQFHPSYDYSDFVEGLRPKVNDDGTMGFELQDGIFKKFVARARKNYEDSQKSRETVEKEVSVQESMTEFFSGVAFGVDIFKTINGNEFAITGVDDGHIHISIPGNASVNRLALNLDEVRRMLESGQKFEKIKDITSFFGKTFATQGYSYDFAIYKAIKAKKSTASKAKAKQEKLKKYIFIIDEINRGEISKIFGELFFAIDPGYRGKAGEISTQYSNLHSDPDEKFYIPENVYIIGTMNDIDRSVDSFDFAMRRRFRFVELRADERLEMLASLENEELEAEAIRRMAALNKAIAEVEDLNENYQIGASYFLKLKTLDFDQLWTDYLQPLLQEYIQGMYDEEGLMNRFAKAYGYQKPIRGDANEAAQDQG